jgi:hypothetical protein
MAVRNCAELGENLQAIMKRLCTNQDLLKLLYYTDKDPFGHEDVPEEVIKKEIWNKLIKIIPVVGPKETAHSMAVLRVIGGTKIPGNSEFRMVKLAVEIFVPLTQWFIKSENLRPFHILGEIQNSLGGKTINGLGKMEGGDFALNFVSDEICSYEMYFDIIAYD